MTTVLIRVIDRPATIPDLIGSLFAACRRRSGMSSHDFAAAINDLVEQTARHPLLNADAVRVIEQGGEVRMDVVMAAQLLAGMDPAAILQDLVDRVERE